MTNSTTDGTEPAAILDPTAPRRDRKRPRDNRDFWRATRALWPYRKTVAISVGCAVLTGAFTAGGLVTLVPLMNVLVRNNTVASFADQVVVARQFDAIVERDGDAFVVGRTSATYPLPTAHGDAAVGDRLTVERVAFLARTIDDRVPLYLRLARRVAQLVPRDPIWAIGTTFGLVVLLALCGSVARFFQEYLSETTAIRAINDIRRRLYDHMLHLPLAYFTRHGSSDLTARLVSDASGLQEGFKTILGKAVQAPITASFSLAAAMVIDWRLTIFVIVFTPLMVTVIRKLGKKVRRAMRGALERNAAMLGQIESSFVGVRVVKSAAAEPFERRRYRAILDHLRVDQNRMARYDAWSTPLLEMLGLLAGGFVLMIASWLIFRHKSLSIDQLIPLMICLVATAEPLRQISKLNTVIQKGNAAASRIWEIFNEPAEIRGTGLRHVDGKSNHVPEARATSFNDSISFEHLTFSYPNGGAPAILDLSLTVKKGTSVAIVGRNGSGKTTLLSLLPRFFEPDAGAIKIDGVDIRRWPLKRLRRLIGIVTQEAVLFPGTIAQNIAYADPTQPTTAIEHAARRASADAFILQKPDGYATALDGLGGQLSGGQRQRINIARAILRDTPILILDEATSQVDAESEHLIQSAIAELMKDRTTFVIAHRFSTILGADLIVVMEAGRIVGQGKHEELLETCETYRQLYERQMVG